MASRRSRSRKSASRKSTTARRGPRGAAGRPAGATAVWLGALAVAGVAAVGTAVYLTNRKSSAAPLPPGPPSPPGPPGPPGPAPAGTPPTDQSCAANMIVDAVTWQCAPICPDDSRPCNGLCVGYNGGPFTPQGTSPKYANIPTGSTLAPQTTYLE